MKRGGYLKRNARLKPGHTRLGRNPARSRQTFARNFGTRAEAVRAMPCLCGETCAARYFTEIQAEHANGTPDLFEAPADYCDGPVQACHVRARGMGGAKGDRHELVPLCARHHADAGEHPGPGRIDAKRHRFEAEYGLDLKLEAKRIAEQLDREGHQ